MSDIEEIDIRLKLARIDRELAQHGQLLANRDRKRQEIRFAPWQIAATLMGGAAAFFAAGAAFVKLING